MTGSLATESPARPVAPPRWGVLGFTALIAITPALPYVPILGSPVDVSDLGTLAAAAVGIVAALVSGCWRSLRIRRAPEAFALALMVPFTLIAALHAGSLHSVAAGPARWLLNALVVALAYLMLRTPGDGQRMIRALVAVAAFEAAFGLVAYALRWSGPGGYLGIMVTGGKIGGMPVWGRITGTTAMAATFIGGLFALTLPIAVGLAMAARGRARWAWSGTALVIFGGLLFTLSRTPIGLAAVAVAVLLLAATRPRVWVPILVAAAAVFLATPLRARMTNFQTDRLALWDAGWRMFTDHWFFGVGPDRYMQFFDAYKQTRFGEATSTPHNSLLYVAAESGLLAALALALAIALSFRFLRTRRPLVLGPMLGLAAFMVDAMTTNLYSIASIAVAAWMIAPSLAPLFAGPGSQPPGHTDTVTEDPRPAGPVTDQADPGDPVTDQAGRGGPVTDTRRSTASQD
ncbi:MAG TPA: O-antigen ligase family protein [Nakamurella sp.]|nr:O-antigen ligase family protein [Nakamurella sp.]